MYKQHLKWGNCLHTYNAAYVHVLLSLWSLNIWLSYFRNKLICDAITINNWIEYEGALPTVNDKIVWKNSLQKKVIFSSFFSFFPLCSIFSSLFVPVSSYCSIACLVSCFWGRSGSGLEGCPFPSCLCVERSLVRYQW